MLLTTNQGKRSIREGKNLVIRSIGEDILWHKLSYKHIFYIHIYIYIYVYICNVWIYMHIYEKKINIYMNICIYDIVIYVYIHIMHIDIHICKHIYISSSVIFFQILWKVRGFWRLPCFCSLKFFAALIFADLLFNIFIYLGSYQASMMERSVKILNRF